MTTNLVNGEAPKGLTTAPPPPVMSDALRRAQARTPQESLGLNDAAGLGKAFAQATVLTAIVFAALTAGPYFLDRQSAAAPVEKAAPTDTPDANPTPSPAPFPSPIAPGPDASAKKTPDPGVKSPPGKKDLPDVLGESGTKNSKPGVNPLDKKTDDLLDGLK